MVDTQECEGLYPPSLNIASSLLCDFASLSQAQNHRLATSVQRLTGPEVPDSKICPCCLLPFSDRHPFPFCGNIDHLSELGPAFPLLFYLNSYLALLLFLVLCIASVPNLIENVYANQPSSDHSKIAETSVGDFGNHDFEYFQWPVALNAIALIAISLCFFGITWHAKKVAYRLDVKSISKFAIVMENISKDWSVIEIKRDVSEFVQRKDGANVNIVAVDISYDIREYLSDMAQFREHIINAAMFRASIPKKEACCGTCARACTKRQVSLNKTTTKVLQAVLEPVLEGRGVKTGYAFLTFATANQARTALKCLRLPTAKDALFGLLFCGKYHSFKGKRVRVSRAAEPTDIKWSNLHFSRCSRICRQLFTWTVLAGILAGSFFMLFELAKWQNSLSKAVQNNKDNSTMLHFDYSPIPAAGIILMVNLLLEATIRIMAEWEHHPTYTEQTLSIAHKLTIALSLNTLIFQPFVNISSDEGYAPGVLASNMFWVAVSTAFSRTLLRIFDPRIAWKWIRKVQITRAITSKRLFVPQFEANSAYQKVEIDLADCYADLMVRFLLALAYTPLLPVIVPVTLIGYGFNYVINKCVLLKMSCRPRQLNKKIMQDMLFFVKVAFVLYAFAIYYFYGDVNSKTKPYGIAAFIISGTAVVLHWFVFACFRPDSAKSQTDALYIDESSMFPYIAAKGQKVKSGQKLPTGIWAMTARMPKQQLMRTVKAFTIRQNSGPSNEAIDQEEIERDENADVDAIGEMEE